MKTAQFLSTFAVLGLAASVTTGSMYVTLRAAAQQEEGAAQFQEADGSLPTAEAIADQVAESMNAPLEPDAIISNRSEDIVLDAAGSFNGHLASFSNGNETVDAANMTVQVIQDGISTATTTTAENGSFSFKDVKPGVAAILASSETGFMLFGVRFVATDADHPASEPVDLESTVIRGADLPVVRSLIEANLTAGDIRFVDAAEGQDQEFQYGTGEPATSIMRYPVQLQADGSLYGIVSLMDDRTGRVREVLDLTVYFIRDGKVVEDAEVENSGEFLAKDLSPGIYSAVGVGKDGTFAFSVEVISAPQVAKAGRFAASDYQTTSVRVPVNFAVAAANASNFNTQNANSLTNGQINPGNVPPGPIAANPVTPAPGGGAAGGGGAGGGGGGGAGGGGGLGALLGAGIAGGIGYLVGQDDNPASPGQ